MVQEQIQERIRQITIYFLPDEQEVVDGGKVCPSHATIPAGHCEFESIQLTKFCHIRLD